MDFLRAKWRERKRGRHLWAANGCKWPLLSSRNGPSNAEANCLATNRRRRRRSNNNNAHFYNVKWSPKVEGTSTEAEKQRSREVVVSITLGN